MPEFDQDDADENINYSVHEVLSKEYEKKFKNIDL